MPYGAFGGGADVDYPLWFGGKTANEAVVKFGKNGNAWLGRNFSVVNEDVNVTGNLHVNSLFLKQGGLIMKGGKKYLNLDNRTGNYLIIFLMSLMVRSKGPECSSFRVHMAAANFPASSHPIPCERQ